ncbi:MAG: Fur family transcriptional regulator [Anaerolineae bacterium]
MADAEQRFQQLKDKLRRLGYRLTPQRVALLRLLSESRDHPSAKDLYDQLRRQFPTTSLATIYKTLNVLKDLDEVLELGFSDDDNRYDGNKPYPHPHLICIRCRRIIDFDRDVVAGLEQELAQASGFEIVSHRLDFYGLCPECRRKE